MDYKKINFSTKIIEHLGKDLITAPEVAFVELIKNSIDASVESEKKRVQISCYESIELVNDNTSLVEVNRDLIAQIPDNYAQKPFFVIEDLGCGMDEKTLERGFLSIGTDIKKHNRENGEIILGEKGIGRLAAQRLGKFLIVETASKNDTQANIVAIEWDKIVSGRNLSDVKVPYMTGTKMAESYTRLWIFDVNVSDLIREDGQIQLFRDYSKLVLNSELDNAVCFLISPFQCERKISIQFFYNGHLIDYGFNKKMLNYAESIHSFYIDSDPENSIVLRLNLEIKPWLIERIHRACIRPQKEFGKYKKNVKEYESLIKKYETKFRKTFNYEIEEADLISYLVKDAKKEYSIISKNDNEEITDYLTQLVTNDVNALKKIIPIRGEIYSYKKDSTWCGSALEFCKEDDCSIKEIQDFLNSYNGIKLYRNQYRIGFLGNKDNDWLKLQQYKTLGHQFYRFNLGTTLGFISITDPLQQYIKEISSRLDINKSQVSNIFMKVVEKVCNESFYKFNEAITEMTKEILSDEGWLQGNIKKKIEKNDSLNKELKKQNSLLKKQICATKEMLANLETTEDGSKIIDAEKYNETLLTFEKAEEHISVMENFIQKNGLLLEEAKADIGKIEVEAYNNYKLMANGLVTETITHELHSLVATNSIDDVEVHFNTIVSFLWENNMKLYNNDLLPIKEKYYHVLGTLDEVSDLYKFLENTFIKNNSVDEFELVNIQESVGNVEKRLLKELEKAKIRIITLNCDINWYLPKGVLLHVLYNLITNAKYWIDVRRKRAIYDLEFVYKGEDFIKVEGIGNDSILIYDSGTGVKHEMEEVLFQPLQSGKGPDGRGMGLYIVKKLLKSFKAKIELLDEKNEYGNRYKFKITVLQDYVR